MKKYYNYEGNEGNKTLWDVEERWIDDFYTFFAVKDNADKIKRKIFANSKRNDEYATSVLCIQFSKMAGLQLPEQMWYIDGHKRAFGYNWNLYIQNRYDIEFNLARYNKTGYSPIQNNAPIFYNDRTFGNNLDNIVFGLSRSFEKYYGLKTKNRPYYHLPGYVKAKDGRYYKYNYRKISDFSSVVDICFCPNNTIIDNGEVIKLPEDKYLLIDYFILDLRPRKSVLHYIKNVLSNYDQDPIDSILKGRRIAPYYKYEIDSFPKSIPDKSQVMVRRYFEGKEIIISSPNKEDIIITINKNNVITELVNNNIEEVGDMFLAYNYKLENFEAKKLRNTGKCFVKKREQFLSKFNLPNYNQTTNLK